MAKKKPGYRMVNIRMPEALVGRVERAAGQLGITVSGLFRMIITEKLHEYEARGRKAGRGGGAK